MTCKLSRVALFALPVMNMLIWLLLFSCSSNSFMAADASSTYTPAAPSIKAKEAVWCKSNPLLVHQLVSICDRSREMDARRCTCSGMASNSSIRTDRKMRHCRTLGSAATGSENWEVPPQGAGRFVRNLLGAIKAVFNAIFSNWSH